MTDFKEFSWERYQAGEEAQYRKGGIPLEIHLFKCANPDMQRLISVNRSGEFHHHYDNGYWYPRNYHEEKSGTDLVMKPKKKTYYINVYKRPNGKLVTYNNSLQIKEPEVIIRDYQDEFIGTFPIEIEE